MAQRDFRCQKRQTGRQDGGQADGNIPMGDSGTNNANADTGQGRSPEGDKGGIYSSTDIGKNCYHRVDSG